MHTQYAGTTRRGVYQCKAETASGACWSLPAHPIDHAVTQLFLDAAKPPQIELGLAILRETERQTGDIERQWKLRMERARYAASLAERRYKAVDPDNRVIARTLEREWNDALLEIEQIEREQQELRRREHVDLSEEDRAQIVALSKDLTAVWKAETTTNAERKNLLRMLVRQITLSPMEVPTRGTRVQVLWQTGAVSEVLVARTDKFTVRTTPPRAVAYIRDSLGTHDDTTIAAELNRQGVRTGAGLAWNERAVRCVRYAEGWHRPSPRSTRVPDRDKQGRWSTHAVATKVGVKPDVVRFWMRTGVLEPVERAGTGRAAWFDIDLATLQRLRRLKSEMEERRRAVRRLG